MAFAGFVVHSLGGVRLLVSLALIVQALHGPAAYQINDTFVSSERRLYKYLLEGYEKSVRPVKHESDTVQLDVHYQVYYVDDLKELNQALYTTGFLHVSWSDFQLGWSAKEFGGISYMNIPVTDIWLPDINVINSIEASTSIPSQHTQAVVDSSGLVLWVVPVTLRTVCHVDLTTFPFDEQTCPIKFGLWTFHEKLVNLSLIEFDYYGNWTKQVPRFSPRWIVTRGEVKRNSVIYPCCPESYVDVTFTVNLKRVSSFATHLFLAPSVALGLIIPGVFALPPASTEKMAIGAGVLVTHVLLLGELINYVPSQHRTVPLMGQFFLANIVLVALSLAISAVVINIWSRSQTRIVGPPAILHNACLGSFLTRALCINFDNYTVTQNEAAFGVESHPEPLQVMSDLASDDRARIVTTDHQRIEARADWRRLAIVIDRLFLVLYLLVTVALSLAYIGYL
jgi:hypothetical protein